MPHLSSVEGETTRQDRPPCAGKSSGRAVARRPDPPLTLCTGATGSSAGSRAAQDGEAADAAAFSATLATTTGLTRRRLRRAQQATMKPPRKDCHRKYGATRSRPPRRPVADSVGVSAATASSAAATAGSPISQEQGSAPTRTHQGRRRSENAPRAGEGERSGSLSGSSNESWGTLIGRCGCGCFRRGRRTRPLVDEAQQQIGQRSIEAQQVVLALRARRTEEVSHIVGG